MIVSLTPSDPGQARATSPVNGGGRDVAYVFPRSRGKWLSVSETEGGERIRPGTSRSKKFARRLRKTMTNAEVRLWVHLRGKQLDGHRFRRQHPVGPYIADFACPMQRLIIEVDGDTHTDAAYDARRTQFLEAEGWQVLRVFNVDVYENLEGVMDRIGATLAELQRSKSAAQAANKKVDKDLDPRSGKD